MLTLEFGWLCKCMRLVLMLGNYSQFFLLSMLLTCNAGAVSKAQASAPKVL